MPDGAERDEADPQRMSELVIGSTRRGASTVYRYENVLVQPWLARLQVQPVPAASVAVSRHRHGAPRVRASNDRPMIAAVALSLRIAVARGFAVALALAASPTRMRPIRTKMLRVALPIAETGFDPQATSDLYSQHVNRAIFDPLYVVRLPRASVQARAEHRGGAARDLGRRHDVDDQASSRASTSPTIRRSRARSASSSPTTTSTRGSACSTRRCARRTLRYLDGKLVGADDVAREGEEGRASSTTTRRSKACRRSTATRCGSSSKEPDYVAAGRPDDDRRRRRSRAR